LTQLASNISIQGSFGPLGHTQIKNNST